MRARDAANGNELALLLENKISRKVLCNLAKSSGWVGPRSKNNDLFLVSNCFLDLLVSCCFNPCIQIRFLSFSSLCGYFHLFSVHFSCLRFLILCLLLMIVPR